MTLRTVKYCSKYIQNVTYTLRQQQQQQRGWIHGIVAVRNHVNYNNKCTQSHRHYCCHQPTATSTSEFNTMNPFSMVLVNRKTSLNFLSSISKRRHLSLSSVAFLSTTTTTTTTTTTKTNNSNSNDILLLQNDVKDTPKLHNTIYKVLIANRGEIACRIIRTCRALNISTVAIYSTIDGPNCTHAQMADEAYCIGTGPTSSESYLLMMDIIQIAKRTNTTAIHPGFGFLSENVHFAQLVMDHNFIWIGPPIQSMLDMSSKSRAKQIMAQNNVPITPGYDPYNNSTEGVVVDVIDDDTTINEQLYYQAVHHVGFPLIIKAVLGGGGKGMRLVHDASEFQQALVSCQNEAYQSFRDKRVLLERYLIHPKHIEVQILGDIYGNIIHLYERDCSIQRRHQKVLEEAPSVLSNDIRNYITDLGVRAASAVNYVNAGTVEFLIDTQPQQHASKSNPFIKQENNEFSNIYFCEMNTRLQVEHSITEQITGIDIVEWQLRIAAGEPLPIIKQNDIPSYNGHSIEARIYAETPIKQFLPSPGKVWFHEPPTIPNVGTDPYTGVRVDTGIQTGQDVSVYYDPMIAKLICHGRTRYDAIQKLQLALQRYKIAGVSTNIDFLLQCIQQPLFYNSNTPNTGYDITTGFLDVFGDEIIQNCKNIEQHRTIHPIGRVAAVVTLLLHLEKRITNSASTVSYSNTNKNTQNNLVSKKRPWSSHWGSWRIGGSTARVQRKVQIILPPPNNDQVIIVTCISNFDGSFDIQWGENKSDTNKASDESKMPQNELISFSNVQGTLNDSGAMEIVIDERQRIKLKTVMKKNDSNGIIQMRMWPDMPVGGDNRDSYYWEVDVVDPVYAMIHSGDTNTSTSLTTGISSGQVIAPMPGKISRINNRVGDTVKSGDIIMVMEAMKMEHPCSSPCNGILSELRYDINMVVPDSVVLFVITPQNSSTVTSENE